MLNFDFLTLQKYNFRKNVNNISLEFDLKKTNAIFDVFLDLKGTEIRI